MKYNNSSNDAATIFAFLLMMSLFFLAAVGWVLNIAKILQLDSIATGEAVVRIIGVFLAPIGAVAGYL